MCFTLSSLLEVGKEITGTTSSLSFCSLEGSKISDKGASPPGRSLKVKRRIQELE